MYNQNMVMFINDFINKSISETSRITNLYIDDMATDANNIKNYLLLALKDNFGPFLADSFNEIEQIIEDNWKDNVELCPTKIHEVEKLIINQYRHLEIEIQRGLSQTPDFNHFEVIMNNLNNNLTSNLKEIEQENNTEISKNIGQSFFDMQGKADAYFNHIGLTNQSICIDIKHTIDIYQSNLLDKIEEKIPALIFVGNENIKVLSTTILNKINIAEPISLNNNTISTMNKM